MIKLFVTLLILLLPSLGWATTFYVDENGNDDTGDGSIGTPWATLSHACGAVSGSTDVIHINAGTITDNAQCVLAVGVDIEGAGKALTTINTTLSGTWQDNLYIKASSGTYVDGNHEISGFTLSGGSVGNRVGDNALGFWKRSEISIHDVKFQYFECPVASDTGGAIHFSGDVPAGGDENTTPPSDYMTNIYIYNCDFIDCGRLGAGTTNYGSIVIWGGVENLQVYDCTFDESGTDGQTIKTYPGWLKGCSIHDNSFKVSAETARNAAINIELWNLEDDTEIYNNTFENGYLSLVSGRQGGGTWACKFYNNLLINTGGNEFSVDYIEIYNNYFDGYWKVDGYEGTAIAVWQTHAFNMTAVNDWYVHNNIITGAYNYGIIITDKGAGACDFDRIYVYNNVVYSVGGNANAIRVNGFHTDSDFDDIEIKNNIIMSNGVGVGSYGDYEANIDALECTYNYLYDNTTDTDLAATTDPVIANNTDADPLFTNAAGGDFTLTSVSPCIGAGADLGNGLYYGLDPTSTWPDNVKPLDQDDYEDWEIGAYVYILAGPTGGPGTIAGGGSGTIAGGGTGTIIGTTP